MPHVNTRASDGRSMKRCVTRRGGRHGKHRIRPSILGSCAAAAFMAVVAACGGDGSGAPPPPQPVSLAISGLPTAAMLPGQSAQLMATLTYSDASTQDVTTSATWSTTERGRAVGVFRRCPPGTRAGTGRRPRIGARPQRSGHRQSGGTRAGTGAFRRRPRRTGQLRRHRCTRPLRRPGWVATDASGNVYAADHTNHTIRRIGLTES